MTWKIPFAFALLCSATFPAERDRRIAFVKGADVYTVAADGSDLRQLTRLGSDAFAELPSWEPDDDHILYTVRFPELPRQRSSIPSWPVWREESPITLAGRTTSIRVSFTGLSDS